MRYEWPGGEFDAVGRVLISGDRVVQLTPKESDCLHQLALAGGKSVSVNDLGVQVWHHQTPSSTGTYQQAIKSLRKKLRLTTVCVIIQTVRKSGYRLVVSEMKPGQPESQLGTANARPTMQHARVDRKHAE